MFLGPDWGFCFLFFVWPTPQLGVGACLGNRCLSPEFWSRFRWFMVFTVLCSYPSCRSPPAPEPGTIWIKYAYCGVQECLAFCLTFRFFVDALAPPPMQVVWRWLSLAINSCPLSLGLPLFLFGAYLAGLVTLPFRGVGVGFEEPHLQIVF